MNKHEFITSLERHLALLPKEDRQEILYDYEEHFRSGAEAGKSEEEVAESLGSPESLAKLFRADYLVDRSAEKRSARNLARAFLAVAGLGMFNIVIIVPPFLVLSAVLFGLLMGSLGMTLGGLTVLTVYPLRHPILVQQLSSISFAGVMLMAAGLVALGLLCLIGVAALARKFYQLIVRYLKTNLDIIRGR